MEFKFAVSKETLDARKANELDSDKFELIYKDLDIIVDEIPFDNLQDRMLCKDIIAHLEEEAAKQLRDGKCISIPNIGKIRRNPIQTALLNNYKDFKEKREVLTHDEYLEYTKEKMREVKWKLQNEEVRKRKLNSFKKKVLKMYINKMQEHGEVYANFWLYIINKLEPVEFNPDVEEAYQESYR